METPLGAELHAIAKGLEIAINLGEVEIESDSVMAIESVQTATRLHQYYEISQRIRELMGRTGSPEISHIRREANCVADALANRGFLEQICTENGY